MELFFTSLAIKRLIYLILVVGTCCEIQIMLKDPNAYWVLVTGFSLSLLVMGRTFRERMLFTSLIGLIASALVFIACGINNIGLMSPVYLLLVTLFSLSLSQKFSPFYLAAIILNLLLIVATMPLLSASIPYERTLYVLIGAFIAWFYQCIFYFFFIRNELRFYALSSLHNLRLVNREIFSCFLQPTYAGNKYLFERRLHIEKTKFMQSMLNLQQVIFAAKKKMSLIDQQKCTPYVIKMGQLYELMLDYSQLRSRVTDPSLFEVAKVELSALMTEINAVLYQLSSMIKKNNGAVNIKILETKIHAIEDLNHTILQVASREPLVLMLFISSLHAFCKEVTEFQQTAILFSGIPS